jgi:hypothetical protein
MSFIVLLILQGVEGSHRKGYPLIVISLVEEFIL